MKFFRGAGRVSWNIRLDFGGRFLDPDHDADQGIKKRFFEEISGGLRRAP